MNTDVQSQPVTDTVILASSPEPSSKAEILTQTDSQAQSKVELSVASLGLDNQLDSEIKQSSDKMPGTDKPSNNQSHSKPSSTEPSANQASAAKPASSANTTANKGGQTPPSQPQSAAKAKVEAKVEPKADPKADAKSKAKAPTNQTESAKPHTQANKPTAEPAAVQVQQNNSGLYVGLVALLVALGSAGFVGWQWQQGEAERQSAAQLAGQLQQLQQAQVERSQSLERRLERAEQAQTQQQASTAGQQQSLEALNKQFTQMQSQTQQALSRKADLQTELPEPPKAPNWYIAEADYLVRMASRKLWLEQDAKTAFALLNDADNRIMAMDRAELMPIRQALAEDMAALSALPKVDRAGLSLKIEVLIKRIDTLPLNSLYLPKTVDPAAAVEPSADINDWRANLEKSWKAMTEDFITVRRRTGEVQPLIAPEHEWYLRENVRGKLMQAQLSLYQGHSQAFEEALATARLWIGDYFDQKTPAVANAIEQIDQWAKTPVGNAEPIKFTVIEPLNKLVNEELDRG